MIHEFLNKKLPAYLCSKSRIISLVVFTAVFALVFIMAYNPFDAKEWYNVSEFMYYVYLSLLILVGVLVVAISRVIMYYYAKKHTLHYWSFGVWILAEILAMAAIYTSLSLIVEPNPTGGLLQVMKNSIRNTTLVLLIPYAISLLYFSMQEKNAMLKRLKAIQDYEYDHPQPATFSFYDERGEMRLSIKRDNLLYLESADNYVYVWYLNKGKVTKFLLRNTLKVMEDFMAGTNVLRCHRSYMVNFDQVSIIRRDKGLIYIEFGIEDVGDIPVSKTYSEKVMKSFAANS
ncbi:MAG: LytTR family DNA-binding domain-containing protein [Bacteroidales bacterium]|nr:LytTR family DNA-binding domain-containing protein [Bacteroidales bacterium]